MAQPSNISMLVCWQNRRRKIVITNSDNLEKIQETICNMFELAQLNSLHQYQIQFYDTEFGEYIDLYDGTWNQFLKLFDTLLTPPSLPKCNPEWRLLVFKKMIDTVQATNTESSSVTNTMHQGVSVDDHHECGIGQDQGQPDVEDILDNMDWSTVAMYNLEDELFLALNELGNSTISDVLQSPVINNPENITSQSEESDDEYEQEEPIPIPNPVNHQPLLHQNYNLRFDPDLTSSQRLQTQGQVVELNDQGVCVRIKTLDGTSMLQGIGDIYPALKFNSGASTDRRLYLYVLTEADENQNHYVHPSKEILIEENLRQTIDRNNLQTTTSVNSSPPFANPLIVTLSLDGPGERSYSICRRVFNCPNLSSRKHYHLIQFDKINSRTGRRELVLAKPSAPVSLSTLGLSHKKFCLGSLLIEGNEIVGMCFSSMATEKDRSKNSKRTSE